MLINIEMHVESSFQRGAVVPIEMGEMLPIHHCATEILQFC